MALVEISDFFGIGKAFDSAAGLALIEKVGHFIGIVGLPVKAYLEGCAAEIKADSDNKTNDMTTRARRAAEIEEIRHQQNKKNIIKKAVLNLTPNARPQDMDEDWLANFFDRSKIVSKPEMQSLWGRILAGEANVPGSFSKHTVNLLSSVGKPEAILFENLCRISCYIYISLDMKEELIPFVIDAQEEIYNNMDINFDTLSDLETLGLIRFEALTGYMITSKEIKIRYHNQSFTTPSPLHVGKVRFSKAGRELASIIAPEPVPGFYDFLCRKLIPENMEI